MRVSLDHAHIFAIDAAATVRFFEAMFGATIVWDEVVAGARAIRVRIGRAFVNVYDQPPKAPRGGAFQLGHRNGRDLISAARAAGRGRWAWSLTAVKLRAPARSAGPVCP